MFWVRGPEVVIVTAVHRLEPCRNLSSLELGACLRSDWGEGLPMIEDRSDTRTLANMQVALERVCRVQGKTPLPLDHRVALTGAEFSTFYRGLADRSEGRRVS